MALHSPRLLSLTRRAFSSSPSSFQGGVSMVQGASRGIGLEFVRFFSYLHINIAYLGTAHIVKIFIFFHLQVKQILEYDDKEHVIATCRNPSASTGLIHLKDKFADRLKILSLDLTVETSIEASALSIKETYGRLNLLINASGILSIPEVMHPETTLNKVEKSSLMLAYEVNAVGPILVIKHMWPLLKVGGGHGTGRSAAVVASLSARVASIGDNRLGGWHSYRSSKASLNQLSKTASLEFARRKDPVVCILLHPGTVDTDLSKPFQRNVPPDKLFTKEFSVQKLLSIINNVKIHDNGKFFAWDGQEIPW
ncbi:hypothetical protein JHK87_023814 [Glycine soja]|nr:hypothetical protein JHK87_023814 [Glycine soja]